MDVFCVHKIRRSLGFVETICQAVSLLFALQNKEGRRRMMDLAEDNPRYIFHYLLLCVDNCFKNVDGLKVLVRCRCWFEILIKRWINAF